MNPKDIQNVSPSDEADRRKDGPADLIDEAVVLASVEGVGPAIEYMQQGGVKHDTAMRVLAGPEFHREPDQGAIARAMRFVAAHLTRARR